MSIYLPGSLSPATRNNWSSFLAADVPIPTSTAQQNLITSPTMNPGVYSVHGVIVCNSTTTPGGLALLLAYPGVGLTEVDSWIPDAHPHFISGSGIIALTTPQTFLLAAFGDGVMAGTIIKRVAPVSNFFGSTLLSIAQIG